MSDNNRILGAINKMREAAAKHDSVCVAYSGGKDSLVVMDLCCRFFKRVEAYLMYFVPGISFEQEAIAFAKERWGVKVRLYPRQESIECLQGMVYCDATPEVDFLPPLKIKDTYKLALHDTGCDYVATGAKKADGTWRRRFMKSTEHWDFVLNPIAEWNKFDVLSYLQAQKIPIPKMRGEATANGIGLSHELIVWLHEFYPLDFEVMCDHFPYMQAVIERRQFFGE